jgi:hypothetical protein
MKKIIVVAFLLFSIIVSAQNVAKEDTVAKPAITAIGKPDGEKTEMKIRLIIPEGAVSKKTNK